MALEAEGTCDHHFRPKMNLLHISFAFGTVGPLPRFVRLRG